MKQLPLTRPEWWWEVENPLSEWTLCFPNAEAKTTSFVNDSHPDPCQYFHLVVHPVRECPVFAQLRRLMDDLSDQAGE